MERSRSTSSYLIKNLFMHGPMKKTVVMGIIKTIKRIEKTAKLKVIAGDYKSEGSLSIPPVIMYN